jgi:hydroxypyruvate reductase
VKPEVVVLAPIYGPTITALEAEYTVYKLWEPADQPQPPKTVRAAVTSGLAGFDGGILEKFPDIGIVACFGVGHGTLDLAAAAKRKVVVTNTPDSSADAVADIGLGLILAVMRRLCEADRFVRAGRWTKGGFPLAAGLKEKTCGIVGLGKIGRGIAARVTACGMSVSYYGRGKKSDVDYRYFSDIEKMAAASDCLVVSCAARPETHHLVNAEVLSALGPQGFLVNIARGSIVDQPALIAALTSGGIAGVGLDVYEDEPNVPQELMAMENVVLLPHVGTSTRDIREERGRIVLENLRRYFAGEPPLTPVSPANAGARTRTASAAAD